MTEYLIKPFRDWDFAVLLVKCGSYLQLVLGTIEVLPFSLVKIYCTNIFWRYHFSEFLSVVSSSISSISIEACRKVQVCPTRTLVSSALSWFAKPCDCYWKGCLAPSFKLDSAVSVTDSLKRASLYDQSGLMDSCPWSRRHYCLTCCLHQPRECALITKPSNWHSHTMMLWATLPAFCSIVAFSLPQLRTLR